MNTLSLTVYVDGRLCPLPFPVRRVVNAGYVGRDQAAVRAHVEELAREGIPPPRSVPVLFALGTDRLTTDPQVEVLGTQTSGEAEYVLLLQGPDIFVGIGSDHTDRVLEQQSIPKSKQICSNVLGPCVWRYADVKAHWDELLLQSWTRVPETGKEILYQQAPLRAILSADALLDLVRSRLKDKDSQGLVIYSGTISLLGGTTIYGDSFRADLSDPATGTSLSLAYRVMRLDYVEGAEEA